MTSASGDPPDPSWREALAKYARRRGLPERDLEDYVQGAFLRLIRSLAEQPDDAIPVRARLARIADCHYRDFLGRSYRRHERLADGDLEIAHDADPEANASTVLTLETLIGALDPLDREIILSHDGLGLSLGEVAAACGITEAGATKRRQRALDAMQATVERWRAQDRKHGIEPAILLLLPRSARPGGWSLPLHGARGLTSSLVVGAIALLSPLLPPPSPDASSPSTRLARLAPESALAAPSPVRASPAPPDPARSPGPAAITAGHPGLPSIAATASTSASAAERNLLGLAQTALVADDEAGCQLYLDQHGKRYPRGALAQERNALLRALARRHNPRR